MVRTAGTRLASRTQQYNSSCLCPLLHASQLLWSSKSAALLVSTIVPVTADLLCSWRMELAECLLHVFQQQAAAFCMAATAEAASLPYLASNSSSRCSKCQDTRHSGQGNSVIELAARVPAKASPCTPSQRSCRTAHHPQHPAAGSRTALQIRR
jgi:hypothetical protein